MKCGVIAAVLLLGTACYAEAACDFSKDICVSQAAFDSADAALANTLALVHAKIENDGFEGFLVDSGQIRHSLAQSQAAWEHYRDHQCAAVFRLMSGGSSRHVDELACMTDITNSRVGQLRELYDVE